MAPQLRAYSVFAEDLNSFSEPISGNFTIICSSSTGESDSSFWILQVTALMHTNPHTVTHIMKKKT